MITVSESDSLSLSLSHVSEWDERRCVRPRGDLVDKLLVSLFLLFHFTEVGFPRIAMETPVVK